MSVRCSTSAPIDALEKHNTGELLRFRPRVRRIVSITQHPSQQMACVKCVLVLLSILLSTESLNQFFTSITETLNSKPFLSQASAKNKISSVAITGSTGMVGSALAKLLESRNIKVINITRRPASTSTDNQLSWDIERNLIEREKLEGVDVVVHLAGEGVASGEGPFAFLGRWSESKKLSILKSRTEGTKLIVDTITSLRKKPKLFISASAVGYYPFENNDAVYDEFSEPGSGFLAGVCREWEDEALKAQSIGGIPTICSRFGIVLSSKGGILKKLLPLFLLGGGGLIGSGQQGFSPVALEDVVGALEYMIDNYSQKPVLRGPVNVCSPNPVNNEIFTKALGSAVSRPTLVPLPEIAARLVFGQMGEEMLLGGQRAIPSKLLKAGYQFKYPDVLDAIKISL